jgi:dTDP-4-dehydrorhamnose reductase
VFSGLPTVELARVIRDHVLPRPDLRGVYHVASAPIAKYDLLKLVASQYGKSIEVAADDTVVIDRSLIADRFALASGYTAPAWPELVRRMHDFQ